MNSTAVVESQTGFHALALRAPILTALEGASYFEPTPIQAAVIPKALTGRDVIGQAQTGTGKTAAFLLPFLNSWRETDVPTPQCLILAPTRELVVQITQEAKKLSPSKHCRAVAIYGGQRFREQLIGLREGCSIIVGTPGRVLDHLGRGTLNLQHIRYVVLDEADRMLDIGFRPDMERILRRCPTQRQTLLMSATVPAPVLRLVHRYMVNPVHINMAPARPAVASIRQSFVTVDEDRKFELLLHIIARERPRQAIIFCQRRRTADGVGERLRKMRKRVATMHGDLPQPQRDQIMAGFRDARIVYLVATDLVGRGIDVNGISHIINYDLPDDCENYVHRIGRTGRMGADGIAISFVTMEQGKQLTAIEAFTNQLVEEDRIAGFEAFRPRLKVAKSEGAKPEDAKPEPAAPIFGRRTKRYSNRV